MLWPTRLNKPQPSFLWYYSTQLVVLCTMASFPYPIPGLSIILLACVYIGTIKSVGDVSMCM